MKKSEGRRLRRDEHFKNLRKYSKIKQRANERKLKRTPKTVEEAEETKAEQYSMVVVGEDPENPETPELEEVILKRKDDTA